MMQCKDIADMPILERLADIWENTVRWGTHLGGPVWEDCTVLCAFPDGVPERLVRAKMAMLIRRGLVDGCTCGCRGDYELTDKGWGVVKAARGDGVDPDGA